MSDLNDRLEIGENIFELIEFSLDRRLSDGSMQTGRYGVNVAKVREVVRMPLINPLASSIGGVAGVFELRGIPIPAINLAIALGDEDAPINPNQQIIVTEFSHKRAGFIVKSTERIRRIAWEKVLPPTSDRHACINGMTLVENNDFLFILDLERILFEIESQGGFHNSGSVYSSDTTPLESVGPSSIDQKIEQEAIAKNGLKLLLVDDSNFVLTNTKLVLEKLGFEVYTASDGQEAKDMILELYSEVNEKYDVIVTDVEMPQMDGLTFTKWIKNTNNFCKIPVLLHTSLSGKANKESGDLVGANDYIIKNDVRSLIKSLEKIVRTQKKTV